MRAEAAVLRLDWEAWTWVCHVEVVVWILGWMSLVIVVMPLEVV